MKKLILFVSIFIAFNLTAQNVGIGTNTPKDLSKLDIESNTSGFLLPRMNTAQRATLGGNVSALGAILSAEYNGLMVFDTDNLTLYMWDSNKSDFTNGGWNNVLDADASVNDADADPNNELQTITKSGSTVTLSNGGGSFTDDNTTYNGTDFVISGQGAIAGNFVTGADGGGAFTYAPDNVNDADSNPNNEIQNLSSSASGTNRTINISSGTGTTINVADNDNSSTNEIQALSISGSTVSLSNGGGSVTVPSSADNLGNHNATTRLLMGANDIIMSNGRFIETQDGDQNIQIADDNPTWEGDVYGGVTRFFGDGNAATNKLEAGGLELFRNLRVGGLTGAGVRMVVADAEGDLSTQTIPSGADNLGNHLATTNLNMNNREIDNINFLDLRAGNGYGLRFWSSDSYKIHMGSAAEYQYGPVSDYSIKTNMNSTDNIRGWTWGVNGVTPVAAINTEGHMALRGSLFLDCAECGSTTEAYPATGGAYGDLLIQGRVLSANSNLHLSPPGGSDVVINTAYRGAGGATGVANLVVDDGRVYTNSAGSTFNRSALAHDITGLFDGAAGFSFSQRGVVISSDEAESGGFQGNGNNANIWSPGDADLVRFYDEDGMVLRSYINGFSGAYTTASDIRKKQNIEKIDNALYKVLQLNGYNYEFKLHPDEIEKGDVPVRTAGVIVQEVQEFMPELVDDHGDDGLYMNYSGLIPYLIEATKTQHQEIEELKKKMELQQLQINKLEELIKK